MNGDLARRIASVRSEIDQAAAHAGRDPSDVTLVVVTKAASPDIFPALAEAGVQDLGENRIQGAAHRLAGFEHAFRWHFVGHLQSNKVRRAVPLFDVFHGVDSMELMERIDRVAGELGRTPDLMLQVNVSGEETKSGFPPEQVGPALQRAGSLRHARLVGLMTMAPRTDDAEHTRAHFRALASLRAEHGLPTGPTGLRELSMGMTGDFAVAVEEGATMVRIGRRIVAPDARGQGPAMA